MKLEITRGTYVLKFEHVSNRPWTPFVMAGIANPWGEHFINISYEELPKLISFLQAIDQDNQRGGAE